MPYLHISTNVNLNQEQTKKLCQNLIEEAAKWFNKDPGVFMVHIHPEQCMMLDNNDSPLAFAEGYSLSLKDEECPAIASAFTKWLVENLNLSAERIYLNLAELLPSHFAVNGKTFT